MEASIAALMNLSSSNSLKPIFCLNVAGELLSSLPFYTQSMPTQTRLLDLSTRRHVEIGQGEKSEVRGGRSQGIKFIYHINLGTFSCLGSTVGAQALRRSAFTQHSFA